MKTLLITILFMKDADQRVTVSSRESGNFFQVLINILCDCTCVAKDAIPA